MRIINYLTINIVVVLHITMQQDCEAAKANFMLKGIANGLDESPVQESFTAVGRRALLPCDISPPIEADSPLLVIFFRGSKPIYSVDARNGDLKDAVHWNSPEMNSRRLSFRLNESPFGLELPSVRAEDSGDYHCRIDFLNSPTRNLRVKLHVAEPPSSLKIEDEDGNVIEDIIGPFTLGESLNAVCVAIGGKPKPKISWWLNGNLVDHVIEESRGIITSNSIILPGLSRSSLGRILQCQASSSDLTDALRKSVKIDMRFPPENISIEGLGSPLMEQNKYKITCRSFGSRPPANITWWKNGRIMSKLFEQEYSFEDESKSTLTMTIDRADNGTILSCRSENAFLMGSAIETSDKIIAHFPPKLEIKAGQNINLSDVKEGEDIYLECISDANPPVKNIEWSLNGEKLRQKISDGIILSSKNLVLQNVKASSSGSYVCKASNSRGSAESSSVTLDIKFAPRCAQHQQAIYGGSNNQVVNISCQLLGNPLPEKFHWAFNTSSELLDLPMVFIQRGEGKSVIPYHPRSHLDFGSVLCYGENKVGKQHEPCVFQVVPATVPEPVRNCTAWQNASEIATLLITCLPGWNGGLEQHFVIQISQHPDGPVIYEDDQSRDPIFSILDLPPGRDLFIKIYGQNSQGRSSKLTFSHFTPIDIAEERLSAASGNISSNRRTPDDKWKKIFMTVCGMVSGTTLVAIIFLVTIKIRRRRHSNIQSTNNKVEINLDRDGTSINVKLEPDVILITPDSNNCDRKNKRQLNSHKNGMSTKSENILLSGGAPLTTIHDSKETTRLIKNPLQANKRRCNSPNNELFQTSESRGRDYDQQDFGSDTCDDISYFDSPTDILRMKGKEVNFPTCIVTSPIQDTNEQNPLLYKKSRLHQKKSQARLPKQNSSNNKNCP